MILKRFVALFFLTFPFFFSSCNSVDGDAQKAAMLKKESINHTRNHRLQEAEQAFREAEEIIGRYRDSRNYQQFLGQYAKAIQE